MNIWVESRAKLRAKHQNRDLRDSSWSDKIYWNYRWNHRGGENGKNLGQEGPMLSSQSYIYKIPPAHKRENTLQRNPSKRWVNIKTVSPYTLLKLCNYSLSLSLSLSLSQFKERLKKRKKRKKDIYSYVLSTDNVADTLNMCVRVCIKKIVIF